MPRIKHGYGYADTQEYRAWNAIKSKCYSESNKDYPNYGGLGIAMDSDLKEDFMAFLKEIGNVPDDSCKWSVDRIDNTKGYIKGNIRWATPAQQVRNRGISKHNTTGYNGVRYRIIKSGRSYYIATWYELDDQGRNKMHQKSFSIDDLGNDVALDEAVKFRELTIQRLNDKGYGYSENHGKAEYVKGVLK